jgi:hypothetical protein
MNELSVAIKDLELQELVFNTIETTSKSNHGLKIKVTIDKADLKLKEFHVDYIGDFHVESAGMQIKGSYLFSIVIYNFEDEVEAELFLKEHEANLAFPMLSKISGLVAKISEEVRSFPLIITPNKWIKKEKNPNDNEDEDDE